MRIAPALFERAFGNGFRAYRNGRYSLKEWDFIDSNYDKFLVYDYKGTTNFWGDNMVPEEYEVSLIYSRDLELLNKKDSGLVLSRPLKSFGQNQRSLMTSMLTQQSMQSGENLENGLPRGLRRPRMTL